MVTAIWQLMVAGGVNATFSLPPRLRNFTGAGIPQAPLRIGGSGSTSASIDATDFRHFLSAAAISVADHCGGDEGTQSASGYSFDNQPSAVLEGLGAKRSGSSGGRCSSTANKLFRQSASFASAALLRLANSVLRPSEWRVSHGEHHEAKKGPMRAAAGRRAAPQARASSKGVPVVSTWNTLLGCPSHTQDRRGWHSKINQT